LITVRYSWTYRDVSDEQQDIRLDPDQMAVLAACGIGWGLDFFEAAMLT
jgi:hypothetical protein